MKNVLICGSVVSSMEDIQKVADFYMMEGYFVKYPVDLNKFKNSDKFSYLINWFSSMYDSDMVIIVKKRNGSLGESSLNESAIATIFKELSDSDVREVLILSGEEIDELYTDSKGE